MSDAVEIDVTALAENMKRKLPGSARSSPRIGGAATIFKVVADVRGDCDGAYDPKFIPIGPYHHGKEGLEHMEDLKWGYLQDLLKRSSRDADLQLREYIEAVKGEEHRARGQYSVKVDLNPTAFVEMLVLDGCFIIEFLIKRRTTKIPSPLTATKWNMPLLRRDLLLLENQVPFFVLQILFDATRFSLPDSSPSTTLMSLALHYISRKKVEEKHVKLPTGGSQPHHLLHLSHLCLLKDFTTASTSKSEKGIFAKTVEKTRKFTITLIYYLVSCFLMCRRPKRRPKSTKKWGVGKEKAPRAIPSATELREAGIHFKRKEGDCSMLDISFEEGTIEIPLISIQESTNSWYRNLIAFEQCCYEDAGSRFTSFAVFMDNIIDTPADVALLEENKIIGSKLGSDEEVARFFNTLCKGASLDYEAQYLAELYREVTEYYDSDQHRWRAKLVHDYFSNPWTVASLIAAGVLIFLTAAQTVFAFLAYLRPVSN